MTDKEYIALKENEGNERIAKLLGFLQDNGYEFSQFDLGYIVGKIEDSKLLLSS